MVKSSRGWLLLWWPMVSNLFVYLFLPQELVRGCQPTRNRDGPGDLGSVWYPGHSTTGERLEIKQWKMPVWMITIIAFWKATNLIPSKMSLEFARSFDGENKIHFLEISHALWLLERFQWLQGKIMWWYDFGTYVNFPAPSNVCGLFIDSKLQSPSCFFFFNFYENDVSRDTVWVQSCLLSKVIKFWFCCLFNGANTRIFLISLSGALHASPG